MSGASISSDECVETPMKSSEMEIDYSNIVNDVSNKESSESSLLQTHVMNSPMFEKFRSETLPQISNEYCQVSDCVGDEESESSFKSMDYEYAPKTLEPCNELAVKCLQSYDELKKTCQKMGLKFVDCDDGEHLHKLAKKYKLKRCSVKCLQRYEDVRKKCERLNLKLKSVLTYTELYEVDLILADKIEEGEKYYLVKWKNYDLNNSTWEPCYHFTSECDHLVSYYDYLQSPGTLLKENMLFYFLLQLVDRKPCDVLSLVKLCSLVFDFPESHFRSLTISDLKKKARSIGSLTFSSLSKVKCQLLNLMHFAEARKLVLIDLQEWKHKININNPAVHIEVENDVDLERAPTDFEFIHDYVSKDIAISAEPVAFCACDNCYESKNLCCPRDSEGHFAYNKFGRLQLLPGYPIYECNDMCKCGPDCANRVVQHGQKIKVAIFRTSNGCGWGLKTLETIPKDQFVLEYLGEILTSEDAESRGNVYDYVGRSYLFDLDYGEANCQYTIDAGHLGNCAHFINHSCDPNLHVFAVWINNQDPLLPRLAFFAKRKINRGEELTFDYKMVKNSGEIFDAKPSVFNSDENKENDRMLCKCNSKKCRKYLF